MASGQTEIFLSYPDNPNGLGGDFVIDDTGDLLLAIDAPNYPIATEQRIIRLLLTNLNGDIFNPTWGIGLPSQVDTNFGPNSINQLKALINNWLSVDNGVAPSPPPSIIINQINFNTVTISISFTTPTNTIIILPDISLTIGP